MDELHQLSVILIERETIDKDQFERLLAGEAEESIFAEEPKQVEEPSPEPEPEREKPVFKPRPLPGAAMQPPPPDPAAVASPFAAGVFVPEGFEPPSGLGTESFALEPLGPEHNERDFAAWSSSIDHIRSSAGFAPDGDMASA